MSTFNSLRKWLHTSMNSDQQKSEEHKMNSKLGSELFPYTRPSLLGLSKEAGKASADHEIRPILVPQNTLCLNAGYSE